MGNWRRFSCPHPHSRERLRLSNCSLNSGASCLKILDTFRKLVSYGEDEFYIFRLRELQNLLLGIHSKYLEKHGGRRTEKPRLDAQCSLHGSNLAPYRDNWDLLRV